MPDDKMSDEQNELLVKELCAHFRSFRDMLFDPTSPIKSQAERLNRVSDQQLEQMARSLAPLIAQQLNGKRAITEADFAKIAQALMSQPGMMEQLLSAMAKAPRPLPIFAEPTVPSQNADGALLFYRKGIQKLQLGLPAQAKSLFKKSLLLCDSYAPSWDALAKAHEALGELDLAKEAAARANELRYNS
ncbi:MAG: hypothetical protein K2W95_07405 [Candidatus Obscuribacterales bacterium]|nr:hypothetical protein [Candidatus Obscuribacterales bacterium]